MDFDLGLTELFPSPYMPRDSLNELQRAVACVVASTTPRMGCTRRTTFCGRGLNHLTAKSGHQPMTHKPISVLLATTVLALVAACGGEPEPTPVPPASIVAEAPTAAATPIPTREALTPTPTMAAATPARASAPAPTVPPASIVAEAPTAAATPIPTREALTPTPTMAAATPARASAPAPTVAPLDDETSSILEAASAFMNEVGSAHFGMEVRLEVEPLAVSFAYPESTEGHRWTA